jgi:hypothetical protein
MADLFEFMGEFWIVQVSGLIPIGRELIDRETFLKVYQGYVTALKEGKELEDTRIRSYFSGVLTISPESLYTVKVKEDVCLVKVQHPVIQMQAHRFDYSLADNTFRSMVMGSSTIPWGIQFSYPHLCQDENFQVFTVREGTQFPNTSLFKKLQQWVRMHTIATPFEVEGKKINVPIRLGKKCLSWINSYSHLQAKGLKVTNKLDR